MTDQFLPQQKKQYMLMLSTFLGGYYEIASGYVAGGGTLIVPISCAIGALGGAAVLDYLIFPNPERKEMSYLFNIGAHAFLWSFVVNLFLVNTTFLGGGGSLALASAAGAYGAANFQNPFKIFG